MNVWIVERAWMIWLLCELLLGAWLCLAARVDALFDELGTSRPTCLAGEMLGGQAIVVVQNCERWEACVEWKCATCDVPAEDDQAQIVVRTWGVDWMAAISECCGLRGQKWHACDAEVDGRGHVFDYSHIGTTSVMRV